MSTQDRTLATPVPPSAVTGESGDLLYYPPIDTHLVRSKHVAQTFEIRVMQPVRTRMETTRFPVVYATDGNRCFDMFKGISHVIQSRERPASRFILVSIGYPSDSPVAGLVLRARDFTFEGYPRHSLEPPAMEGVLLAEPGTKNFHGAEDFQQFIEFELMPLIESIYPTLPAERTYFGHSAGGGFGLFTLFAKPRLFRNYVVSSPGLIYHGETTVGVRYDEYEFLLDEARRFAASGKTLPHEGARLYMSVGAEEEFEPYVANWRITSSFYRMVALLERLRITGLELLTEVFPGETHMTAWPLAFIRGVPAVLRHRDGRSL